MSDHLGANLNELLAKGRQVPLLYFSWERQASQKVSQIIGQGKQLQSDGIVSEGMARKAGPGQRDFAFLDPLLGPTPLVIKANHALSMPVEIRDNKLTCPLQTRPASELGLTGFWERRKEWDASDLPPKTLLDIYGRSRLSRAKACPCRMPVGSLASVSKPTIAGNLKKLVADLALDKAILQEVAEGNF
jgi:hypothetical protein